MTTTTQSHTIEVHQTSDASPSEACALLLRRSLQVVLGIALLGATFSGVLTYRDLAFDTGQCQPLGPSDSIFGYPPCVYGLAMFSIIVAIGAVGLLRARRLELRSP